LSDGQTESDESTLQIQVRKVKSNSPVKGSVKKKKRATTKKPGVKKTQDSNKPAAAGSINNKFLIKFLLFMSILELAIKNKYLL